MLSSSDSLLSRRRLLGWTGAAFSLFGARPGFAALASSPSPATVAADDDYYAKLGVPTIINAAGTYTYLTAALMPPQVRSAVARAALHPVVLKDLQLASGGADAGDSSVHCEQAWTRCRADSAALRQ